MAREREKYINSINLNSQTDFPYLVLDVVNDRSYPRNPGFHVMHWHEDLQFGYVLEGAVVFETLDESWKVSEGEGFFINKNVIHTVRRLGNCHYKSFIFPTYFLGFYEGSPARDIVDSITETRKSPAFPSPIRKHGRHPSMKISPSWPIWKRKRQSTTPTKYSSVFPRSG